MVTEVLDNLDLTIGKIKDQTKLSDSEIRQKIKSKQEEYGGLLTEAGAAYSIAREYNVKFEDSPSFSNETEAAPAADLKIKDLKEGLVSFNIKFTVVAAFPTKTFEKGSNKGEVTNIQVKDETGETRFVIWGKGEEASKISKGDLLTVKNAYSKLNRDKVEIHMGNRGELSVEKAPEKTMKLIDIKDGAEDVDFYGRIAAINPVYEFNKNGKVGKVSSILVTDGTDKKRLVLWNDHADLSKSLNINDAIKVENAYARMNNELEIHLGWKGRVTKTDGKNLPEIRTERKKISELNEDKDVEIKADVVELYPATIIELCAKCKSMLRNGVCEKCGSNETVKSLIVNAELDDGTGVIRGTFYRDKAEKLLNATPESYQKSSDTIKSQLLGKEFIFFGEVRNVPEYERKEFIVRRFDVPDYTLEIRKLSEVM